MSLQVCIMAPNRIFWKEDAKEIILPTTTGQMGVLTNHMPLITGLDVGVLNVRTDVEWISMVLMGGFAFIRDNKITVVVNEAELGSTIDPEEAQSQFLLAKEALEKATGRKEKIEKNLVYQRARARCQI
jgi:F-type H+-transporting ATPase subunit epsilon